MSEIFAKIYLDEDVNILVAELVRQRGFEVSTVTKADREGKSDIEQLEYAVQNGYAILTHNRVDFENLAKDYFEKNKTHLGIIIAVRRTPYEIAKRLTKILNDFSADEIKNQLIYI